MAPLAKQVVTLPFTGQRQDKISKLLPAGSSILLQDLYIQPGYEGAYHKRPGMTSLTTTNDGGGLGVPLDLNAGPTGLTMADSVSGFSHVWSLAGSKWRLRGTFAQAAVKVSSAGLGPIGGGPGIIAKRPNTVVAGNQLWSFWLSAGGSAAYSCIDLTTGAELVASTSLDAGTSHTHVKAVYDGTNVWAFMVDVLTPRATIRVAKLDPANPGGVVVTVYATASAGSFTGFDVCTSGTTVLVAAVGTTTLNFGGGAATAQFSKLNAATGVATSWTANTAGGASTMAAPCTWLKNSTTTTAYFWSHATAGSAQEFAVTVSSLAAARTTLGLVSGTKSGVTGYVDTTTGHRVYFASDTTASIENGTVNRTDWDGVTPTAVTGWHRGGFMVSEPAKIGTRYLALMGHDDADGTNAQGFYALVDLGTNPIHYGKVLYGQTSDVWQRSSVVAASDPVDYGHHVPLSLWGTHLITGVAQRFEFTTRSVTAGSGDYKVALLDWTVAAAGAPVTGPSVSALNGQQIVYPCAWPTILPAGGASITEASPAMSPRAHTAAGVAGTLPAGTYITYCTYAKLLRDGTIIRSAPTPSVSTVLGGPSGVRVTVPTLRWSNDAANWMIEVWMTAAGGTQAYLASRLINQPTADSTIIDINTPQGASGEILYTLGTPSPMAAQPLPPCTVAAFWRNRLFLAGTDTDGEVWPSTEYDPTSGMTPRFNAVPIFTITDGTGPITAMAPIDFNFLAIFKRDGIWTIDGAGPDNFGAGTYEPRRIAGALGCINPQSVVSFPQGLLFQATDGGIYLLARDGQTVTFVGSGIEQAKTVTMNAAVHVPVQGQVRFYGTAAGVPTCYVLDYWHPADGEVGTWFTWRPPTSNQPVYCATVDAAGIAYCGGDMVYQQDVAGQWYDVVNGVNTAILPKLQLATLSLAGLRGVQQVYRGQLIGSYKGPSTLQITCTPRLSDYASGTPVVVSKDLGSGTTPEQEFRPAPTRVLAMDVTIEEIASARQTEGFALEAIAFEVGVKGRLQWPGSNQRI